MNVIGTVITSSPGFTPAQIRARCRADVPEFRPTQCLTPTYFANAFSNSATLGPSTYAVLSATSASSGRIWSRSRRYWALRSAIGTTCRGGLEAAGTVDAVG